MTKGKKFAIFLNFLILFVNSWWPTSKFRYSKFIPSLVLFSLTLLVIFLTERSKFFSSEKVSRRLTGILTFILSVILILSSLLYFFLKFVCAPQRIGDNYFIKELAIGQTYRHPENDGYFYVSEPENHKNVSQKLASRGWKIVLREIRPQDEIRPGVPAGQQMNAKKSYFPKYLKVFPPIAFELFYWVNSNNGDEVLLVPGQINFYTSPLSTSTRIETWLAYRSFIEDLRFATNLPIALDSYSNLRFSVSCDF